MYPCSCFQIWFYARAHDPSDAGLPSSQTIEEERRLCWDARGAWAAFLGTGIVFAVGQAGDCDALIGRRAASTDVMVHGQHVRRTNLTSPRCRLQAAGWTVEHHRTRPRAPSPSTDDGTTSTLRLRLGGDWWLQPDALPARARGSLPDSISKPARSSD